MLCFPCSLLILISLKTDFVSTQNQILVFFIAGVGEGNLFWREAKHQYLDRRDVNWAHRVVCLPLDSPLSFLTLSKAVSSMMTLIYCYLVQKSNTPIKASV